MEVVPGRECRGGDEGEGAWMHRRVRGGSGVLFRGAEARIHLRYVPLSLTGVARAHACLEASTARSCMPTM